MPEVCAPRTDSANEHIFHQYTLRVERRDELLAHLKEKGIGCAVYYPAPLHLQPCFGYLGYADGRLPATEAVTNDGDFSPDLSGAERGPARGGRRRR